jgi:hypothetical protein
VAATVAHSPEPFGRITKATLHRTIQQVIAQAKLNFPSAPPPAPRQARDTAFTELLDMADIEGEAKEMQVSISDKRVSQRLNKIKETTFGSGVAFREYLRRARLTKQEVRERVRLQLLTTEFERRVTKDVTGQAAKGQALLTFFREYAMRWRARTVCAPAVAIKRCSNWAQP